MDDLLGEFIAETRETLEALAGEIVAWEANPSDRTRLDAIFRFVHTVKGSCGFLDLPRLARLSHAAENVLSAVRDGARTPDAMLVNAVLAIVDRIGEIVEAIDAGAALDDTGEDLLIAALDAEAESVTAEPSITPSAGPVPARAPTRSVRLSVELLDRMMSGMSEMVLARNELARRLRDADADPASEAALERLSLTVADMRETVTRTRMQTIDALFSALPRMVRDTAASLGKHVQLTIEGGDVELDREMIEMMRDPLVHIVRNAIDHGIETGLERTSTGKSETGRLTVRARQAGNTIVIEVSDDGRGIDVERLVTKLVAGGRDPMVLRQLSDKDRLALVFEPGLSSRDEVTAISGRGVGMDVVRANIEQIGGRIDLENRPGRGLTLTIHVPLTLSILPTIVVGACGQRFALARQAIEEIVPAAGQATRIDAWGDGYIATIRDRRMPLVDLPEMLKLEGGSLEARSMLVIVSVAGGSMALAVDDVLDSEELVIKPAAPAVMASGLYAGQTLPDTGLPMLVLDAAGIASAAGLNFSSESLADLQPVPADVAEAGVEALMFIDLDGVSRAIQLTAVDRVEQVPMEAISFAAGRNRVTFDGRIVPIVVRAPVDAGNTMIHIIRLSDGATEIGYAVREICEIVSIVADADAAAGDDDIAGLALVDGRPVEILDAHWLFAELGEGSVRDGRPLCLLATEDGWMGTFLGPVLRRAGYRVAVSAAPGESAVAMLAMTDEEELEAPTGTPIVRLSDRQDGNGIFRYDRRAVLAAVAGAAA